MYVYEESTQYFREATYTYSEREEIMVLVSVKSRLSVKTKS